MNIFRRYGTPEATLIAWERQLNMISGKYGAATYNPPSIASLGTTTTTLTVSGAKLGDKTEVTFNQDRQGIIIDSYVSTTDTVTVVFFNPTGGAIDLPQGTLKAKVTQL